jgi:hypothetical protein
MSGVGMMLAPPVGPSEDEGYVEDRFEKETGDQVANLRNGRNQVASLFSRLLIGPDSFRSVYTTPPRAVQRCGRWRESDMSQLMAQSAFGAISGFAPKAERDSFSGNSANGGCHDDIPPFS